MHAEVDNEKGGLFTYSTPYKCMGLCITSVAQNLRNGIEPSKHQMNRSEKGYNAKHMIIQYLKRKLFLNFRVYSQRECTLGIGIAEYECHLPIVYYNDVVRVINLT